MQKSHLPLCVDLDGTLINTDVLQESLLLYIQYFPWRIFHLLFWLFKGRAYLKHKIAEEVILKPELLPYNEKFLKYLKSQNDRDIYLVTAADEKVALPIADYLGLFKATFASRGQVNLRSFAKAAALVKIFGKKGFVYAGNSRHDLPVWNLAAAAIAVNTPNRVIRKLKSFSIRTKIFPRHFQFTKLFSLLNPGSMAQTLLAFLPFFIADSLDLFSASLGYAWLSLLLTRIAGDIFEKLFDLEEDRIQGLHKKNVFSVGAMHIPVGVYTALLLWGMGIILAFLTNLSLGGLIFGYALSMVLSRLIAKRFFIINIFMEAFIFILPFIVGALFISKVMTFENISLFVLALSLNLHKRDKWENGPNGVLKKNHTIEKILLISVKIAAIFSFFCMNTVYFILVPSALFLKIHPALLHLINIMMLMFFLHRWIKINHKKP